MWTRTLLTATCLTLLATGSGWAQQDGDDKVAPAAKAADAPSAEGAKETDKSTAPSADTTKTPDGDADAAPASGDGATSVRLKSLEQRVNELKERIFRSKARLNLLKETVLHGVIAGSRAVIRHNNEMGSSFRLIKLVYAVDGAQIYSKAAEGDSELDIKREFDVFNGSIVPGNHLISVQMQFRGHGYGIFTYLKGYKFTVRASHTFTAAEGRQNVIVVRAFEKGNVTTELKDRPAVKFEPRTYKVRAASGSKDKSGAEAAK